MVTRHNGMTAVATRGAYERRGGPGGLGLPFLAPGQHVECLDLDGVFMTAAERPPSRKYADRRVHAAAADAAREVCRRCPVVFACLDYALAAREPVGIWGGTTPEARQDILAARGAAS